ncbi:SsgA family sporulation/cell division regulator [Microtetraspora malaysiensis]|uniref:SsgA family sporulation/cell division regulator n=1 Tax=Microtetraspora malaysiensis TaxID=161358 RepID=UPI003D91D5EF
MTSHRSLIYRTTALVPGCPPELVSVALDYTDAAPYEVGLTLYRDSHQTQMFMFNREFLADGLHTEAGQGEVMVRPHNSMTSLVTIRIRPADAYPFEIDLDRETVTDFVEMALMLVPVGQEPLPDFDAELAALLDGGQ